jgi:hypothetical protein
MRKNNIETEFEEVAFWTDVWIQIELMKTESYGHVHQP